MASPASASYGRRNLGRSAEKRSHSRHWMSAVGSAVISGLSRPGISTLAGAALATGFLVYLLRQHWMVFPYYDDWGLAVLDFHMVKVDGFKGQDFSVRQALEFLGKFYMQWGGRVVPFALQIYTFKIGGADAARLLQVSAILAIVALTTRLATQRRPVAWAIAVPIVLYLAIPLFVAARGMYWFSHASHSLWSIPLLLLGVWRYTVLGSFSLTSVLLLAAAAICNEQMAAATLAAILTLSVLDWRRGSRPVSFYRHILLFAPVVCAACFVGLAPGNFARASVEAYESAGVIEHAVKNLTQLSDLVMRRAPSRVFLYAWITSLLCLLTVHSTVYGRRSTMLVTALLVTLIGGGYWLTGPTALIAMMMATATLITRLPPIDGSRVALSLVYASAAALFPVLASPAIYPRSLLTFYVLLFTPLCWAIVSVGRLGRWGVVGTSFAIAILSLPAIQDAAVIYRGYARNAPIHEANQRELERAESTSKSGPAVNLRVKYRMLPSSRFAELMPYQREFIEVWIKKYYSIPLDVKFQYLPPEPLGSTDVSMR